MKKFLPLLFLLFACESKEHRRFKLEDELGHLRIEKVFQEGTWIEVRDSLKADSTLKTNKNFMTRYDSALWKLAVINVRITVIERKLKELK